MRGAAQNKMSPALQKDYVKGENCEQENGPSVISQFLHNLPPLPSSDLTDPQDDITLPRLIEAMQNRHKIRQMMTGEYSKAAVMMGSMFEKLDSSLTSTENLIHEQNGKLEEKDKVIQHNQAEIERLEKKTKIQEHKIDILERTTKIYEDDKRLLQQELETREQRLQREVSDKRRMEQHMHSMITETQLKWERECDRRVNAMQLEMQNKLWVKDEKLKQLKAIVTETKTGEPPDPPPCKMQPRQPTGEEHPPTKTSAFPSPVPFLVDNPHLSPELVPGSVHPTRAEEAEMNPRPICPVPTTSSPLSVSSNSALEQLSAEDNKPGYHSPGTPTRTQSPAGTSASRSRRRAGCWRRREEEVNFPQFDLDLTERKYRTLTPVRPLHRRSCSAGGEKWVDHKPTSSMDLGTVLQPVIPNAIQMSAPSEKVLSKCDRYVLTHQEVASDGEIQTKLIKGEVIKTRGGGQAVQFTDIETLKQKLTRTPSCKRKSPEGKPASGVQSEGAWTNVETRCSLAVGMGAGSDISPGYGHHRNTKRRKR